MKITVGIDWISVTSKNGTTCRHPALETLYTERARGVNGYTVCVDFLDGRIEGRNPQRDDMGIHMIYSGECLTTIAQQGVSALELARWHITQGHKITRIDPYIDLWDSKLSITDLNNQVEEHERALNPGEDATKKRRCLTFSRDILHMKKSVGRGETLYFSRGQPKSMRIYDKAAQQSLEGDWIRIEGEFKAPHSVNVANAIVTSKTSEKTIQSILKRFVDFPDDDIYQLAVGSEYAIMESHRHETGNTKAWILGVVASAIAGMMIKGHENILDELEAAVKVKFEDKARKVKRN